MSYKGEPQNFDYMDNPKDVAEAKAVNEAAARLHKIHGLTGDTLLVEAVIAAGVNLGQTSLEVCPSCGQLYNREYHGEYIDPNDKADIEADLGHKIARKYYYNHYCGFECLMADVKKGTNQ